MSAQPQRKQGRIPVALQAVFLASNRGKEVHKPPPEKAANKVFFRNWLFQKASNSFSRGKKSQIIKTADVKTPTDSKKRPALRKTDSNDNLMNPQAYMDAMLRYRGYSTKRHPTLQSGYYNKPSPHQRASYNIHLIGLIRRHDVDNFQELMKAGLSSNPCNQYNESVAHTVCRHGSKPMMDVLLERGCDFRTADDYGRTPLHDACWAAEPAFEVVEEILKFDVRMFHMIDARGHCPLNYVRKEHFGDWIAFLDKNANKYWPKRSITIDGEQGPPELVMLGPHTRVVEDPKDALPDDMASMVAAGKLSPQEARMLIEDSDKTADMSEADFSDDDEEDEDDSEYDSDDEDWSEEDEELDEELKDILGALPKMAIAN